MSFVEKDDDELSTKIIKTLSRHYISKGYKTIPMRQAIIEVQEVVFTLQTLMMKDIVKELLEQEYRKKGR